MIKSTPCIATIGFMAIVSLMGCSKKEYQSFEELDNANIREYIQQNNLSVHQYKETDLFYEVLEEGTGSPIDYTGSYPIVYTVRSLDGKYSAADTLSASNRYADFFGYFPFGSAAAGTPTVERTGDFKEVIREVLQHANGKVRNIVPSRLMYGRNGSSSLGVPPNASLDYVVTVHDDFTNYEDAVIQQMIARESLNIDEFTKREDGVYYQIVEQGSGDVITADSTITVDYTLKDPEGNVLDSGTDSEFSLAGGVISSWSKVMPLINKGGKIRFFTPSDHAYGKSGNTNIAPFLSLDFEVEVKDE